MAHQQTDSLISKLREMSEDVRGAFFKEAIGSDAMRRAFGRAGEKFLANKGRFDSNVELLLNFVNIPSKADVRDIKTRLDHLNTQIVNLSMKVDRLLANSDISPAKSKRKRIKRGGSSPFLD